MARRDQTSGPVQQGLFHRPDQVLRWNVLPIDVRREVTTLVAILLRRHSERGQRESHECAARKERGND